MIEVVLFLFVQQVCGQFEYQCYVGVEYYVGSEDVVYDYGIIKLGENIVLLWIIGQQLLWCLGFERLYDVVVDQLGGNVLFDGDELGVDCLVEGIDGDVQQVVEYQGVFLQVVVGFVEVYYFYCRWVEVQGNCIVVVIVVVVYMVVGSIFYIV